MTVECVVLYKIRMGGGGDEGFFFEYYVLKYGFFGVFIWV